MEKYSQSDTELAQKVSSGDHEAFFVLVKRYHAMVNGVSLSILRDFEASEDAAQESFLSAWEKIGSLRDPSKLRPWLATISRNIALTHLRLKKRKGASRALDESTKDSAPGPDQVSAHKDDLSLVLATLETLPEKYRTPLVLFYREDQSVAAVAQSLALSQNAVKQRLKRGRDALRLQVESTLAKTLVSAAPSAAFMAPIATALSVLAPPTATAASGLSISSVTTSTSATSTTIATSTMMTSTHFSFATAAVVGLALIPLGFGLGGVLSKDEPVSTPQSSLVDPAAGFSSRASSPIPPSEVINAWELLKEQFGTSPESMRGLYEHIAALESGFTKEALLSILIAEWIEVDSRGGFEFFIEQKEEDQRTAFVDEWLRRDSEEAVTTIRTSGRAWERHLAPSAKLLAVKEPQFFIDHFKKIALPIFNKQRAEDAFRILADYDYLALRDAAISARKSRSAAVYGEALGISLQKWGSLDGYSASQWALDFKGEGKEYALAGALAGWARVDPRAALDQCVIVAKSVSRDSYHYGGLWKLRQKSIWMPLSLGMANWHRARNNFLVPR